MITLHSVILRLDRRIQIFMEKSFYVYILASRRNGNLYIGVTSDLIKRVWEHKKKLAEGFTEKYGVDRLVYLDSPIKHALWIPSALGGSRGMTRRSGNDIVCYWN